MAREAKIYCYHHNMDCLEKLVCMSNALDFLGQAIATQTSEDMYLNEQGRDGLASLFAICADLISECACAIDDEKRGGGDGQGRN